MLCIIAGAFAERLSGAVSARVERYIEEPAPIPAIPANAGQTNVPSTDETQAVPVQPDAIQIGEINQSDDQA